MPPPAQDAAVEVLEKRLEHYQRSCCSEFILFLTQFLVVVCTVYSIWKAFIARDLEAMANKVADAVQQVASCTRQPPNYYPY